jgi:hypothetical protein
MTDTTVNFQKVQDTSVYDVAGNRTPVRRYTIYIGKHGPFTEDVPLAPVFDPNEIDRRVALLTAHLSAK